jgi:large subunit ribosomal protein L13
MKIHVTPQDNTVLIIVQILRLAVSGMLPKNKLRDRRLERLRIFEGDAIEGGVEGNLLSSWGSLQETRPPTFSPISPHGSTSTQTPSPTKRSTVEARRKRRRQAEA